MTTSTSEVAKLLDEIAALQKDSAKDVENTQKYTSLATETEKALDAASAQINNRKKRHRELIRKLNKLKKDGLITPEEAEKATEKMNDIDTAIVAVNSVKPTTGSMFIRLFMGRVNVRVASSRERKQLRDEYDKFKDRTNIMFLVFPLLWALNWYYLRHMFAYTHWITILTHVWLLYYYVSLSVRENILKVNGSNIHPWWIYHHYVSALSSIVVLTWPPETESWDKITPIITSYFFYLGFVQFFQARYQKKRHYSLVAMGKKGSMDVRTSETLTEEHTGLYIIVALVVIAHMWQVYLGSTLLRSLVEDFDISKPWFRFREEIQCALLGILFIFLGVMNFSVTVQVLIKRKENNKLRLKRAKAMELTRTTSFSEIQSSLQRSILSETASPAKAVTQRKTGDAPSSDSKMKASS